MAREEAKHAMLSMIGVLNKEDSRQLTIYPTMLEDDVQPNNNVCIVSTATKGEKEIRHC